MIDRGSIDPDPLQLETDKWIHIRMDLDCENQLYSLYIDGERIYDIPFGEEVDSLERLLFRTGAWRGDVRQFIVDGEPDSKGWYLEDFPGSDERTPKRVFLIDDVKTY